MRHTTLKDTVGPGPTGDSGVPSAGADASWTHTTAPGNGRRSCDEREAEVTDQADGFVSGVLVGLRIGAPLRHPAAQQTLGDEHERHEHQGIAPQTLAGLPLPGLVPRRPHRRQGQTADRRLE